MISNPQAQAIRTNITVEDFGQAMAAIDWSAIPPEKRNRAMAARILTVLLTTATDPTLAARTPIIKPR